MPGSFDQKNEFPNYYAEISKLLGDETQPNQAHVLKLIAKNISKILKVLQIPHVTDDTSSNIETSDFFIHLKTVMQHVVDKHNEANNTNLTLNIFIGGGVVRAILAYIYKRLHTQVTKQKPYRLHDSGQKMPGMQMMLDSITSPEYHLRRLSIVVEESELYKIFVLGVGSDLDIYYTLSHKNPELQRKLEDAATTFINSAERVYNLRDCSETYKHTFLPIADVKELNHQLELAVSQGGSDLDWWYFDIADQNSQGTLHQPETYSKFNALNDYVDGFYN